MIYTRFSDTDFQVSKICLGTMNFVSRCDFQISEAIVKYAWEQGVNFFDTAMMYSNGGAEEFLGRAFKSIPREKAFVVTKVVSGTDKQSIRTSIENSLRRLQMEYVDLYLIHWPVRGMKLHEMMEGLNEVVESGKAKHVGVCNFPAYLLAASNEIAVREGFARLCCNQVAYNLIERGVEIEILPQALLENIAIMAYRPLSMGLLTGKFRLGQMMDSNARGTTDSRVLTWFSQYGDNLERFIRYAYKLDVPVAQLALAWLHHNPAVTAPIVGFSSLEQMKNTLQSVSLTITDNQYDEIQAIFDTEIKEESLQLFPGTKYNFPRLRRKLGLAEK